MVKIAPSILSADFGYLATEIEAVEQAGADWIHVDVMDGQFVPNITLGPPIVAAARKATGLPLDVHLMIESPEHHLAAFARAGADVLTVHVEACVHLHRTLQKIRGLGKKAGVAYNPATPVNGLEAVLDLTDLVLIMSVNPGFGGQQFIPAVLKKVEKVRKLIDEAGLDVEVEIDGGVIPSNSAEIQAAGVSVLVAGSAVYGTDDYRAAIESIRR
jgi:ribulose-phosphate 3-epimerase